MRDLSIKRATASDKEVVARIGEFAPKLALRDRWINEALRQGSVNLVVSDGEVLGYSVTPPGNEYLDSIIVDPVYRFGGVGSFLVKSHLTAGLLDNGYTTSRTYAPDEDGVRFLTKLGYASKGLVENFYPDGSPATFMECTH